MDMALEKEELLRSAGFRYHFGRMAYINRAARKVVSVEAVEDHPKEWLEKIVRQANESGDWRFYFDQPPSPAVVEAFLAELG